MGDSLNPPALHRLTAALRPDWTRTVAARRIAVAGLVVLAAVAAVRSDPRGEYTDTAVAARDLSPGVQLTADDVELVSRHNAALPEGARTDLTAVIGATLAGPVRRGEMLTDVRLLSSRLAEATAGPDARIVPVHLADTALLDMIRAGDVVDVLPVRDDPTGSPPADQTRPIVVATDAVVILVSERPKGVGSDRVALVALPERSANDVAAASLAQALTFTIH